MEITSLSAHADQKEILQWLDTVRNKPANLFLNHGEPHQSDALRCKIEYTFKWENVWVAKPDTPYQLF